MAAVPQIGDRLAQYEIVAAIGAGGMGIVFRARDTRLRRDVALKILPDSFAADAERLARFQREAEVLASLSHPSIAAIHGIEDSNGVRALVLELVEGDTLADRIGRGPLPMADALAIALQIAEALTAAHDRGIIHRDLKPANIKVRPDGTVKVLDFGIAKAMEPDSLSVADPTITPTLSKHATQAGVILGTPAYMSPEQAAGKPVDRRTDLWAFGVVLIEMLTGRQLFTGETASHVLAEVLKSDPDWSQLPDETSASVRRLLRRCLEKNRKRRLDSAADAALEIDDALKAPVETADAWTSRWAHRVALVLAVTAGALVAALLTWAAMRTPPQSPGMTARFAMETRPNGIAINPFDRNLALSPDGRHLVYRAGASVGTGGNLIVRAIDQLDGEPLAGVTNARAPFFSHDSRWIGFFDDSELKKVSITGGSTITLCRASLAPRGASWGEDDTIVFATSDTSTGLWRVPATGGEPTVLTKPDSSKREGDHLFPSILPQGRGVLFTIMTPGEVESSSVAVLDARTGQYKTLIRGGSQAEYVASGHVVYAAGSTLRAVLFDLERLEVLGDPVPVAEHVMMASTGAGNYTLSTNGTLVYVPGGVAAQIARSLVWVDRNGREEPINAPVRAYTAARLSPDGSRVALDLRDQENDLWIWDFGAETLKRLTFDPAQDTQPVWTPDGRRVIFASNRSGVLNLYVQSADGTGAAERLTSSKSAHVATTITPDGTAAVGHQDNTPTSLDLALFPLPKVGASPGAELLVQGPAIEINAEVSPDGRSLAYQSSESGQFEIYVRPFPQVNSGRWQISSAGGSRPAWGPKGRELFYLDGSNNLMAVTVQNSGTTFSVGNPSKVFDRTYVTPPIYRAYDVSPDGRRFLMIKAQSGDEQSGMPSSMVVVLNWFAELRERIPAYK